MALFPKNWHSFKDEKPSKRIMTEEEGKALAKTWQAEYIETSAKTGHNIALLFQKFIRSVSLAGCECVLYFLSLRLYVIGQTSPYVEGEGSRTWRFGHRRERCFTWPSTLLYHFVIDAFYRGSGKSERNFLYTDAQRNKKQTNVPGLFWFFQGQWNACFV